MRASDALVVEPYVLVTETGRRLAAEIGRLRVPVHHGDPAGPTARLTFVRLAATGSPVGPPTVLLAGGPGGSGIEWLTWDDDGWPEFVAGLRAIGDVIALDQRGTGASGPVPWSLDRWDLPLDVPGDVARVVARSLECAAALREHWGERGLDVAMFTTEEIADDVACLVRALGVDQVNLYGISFGSHLGLCVVRRHRGLVARAVLGLVEGPDHTHKLPSVVDAALARVADRAAAAPELGGQVPDLVGEVRVLLDGLAAEPARAAAHGSEITLGRYDLQRAIADCLGSQDDLAELPRRLRRLRAGDWSWLADETHSRRTDWFPDAMYLHTDAASGASASRRAAIAAEAPSALVGGAINAPFPEVEVVFGNPDLGDAFREPITSDVPTLFYSGALDGRTPTGNAEEVMTGFSSSAHLVIDGMAHDDGIVCPEARAWLLDFLASGEPRSGRVALPFRFTPVRD